MKPNGVTIAFRGTAEYRDSLKEAAHVRRINMQELIERALVVYLKGDPATEVAAQRAAEQKLASAGHQMMAIPDDMVFVVNTLLKWRKEQGGR